MRTRSCTAVVVAIILAFSMMNFPILALGQPSGLYPVTVTLSTGEKVFIAAHTSDLEGGNWIKLGGGSTVELPPLALSYEGPDSTSYTRDGVTVTIKSLFGEGGATYPIANHQVYSTDQSVSAKFWGATALKELTVDFKLLKLSSISEAREMALEVFQGNLAPIQDKLNHPTWSKTVNLDGSGDASVTVPSQTAGNYLLVVVKENSSPYELYIYSATVVEVVEQTLPVSAPTSVKKGNPLNVNTGVTGLTYVHGAVLIKKSAYNGEIKLRSEGTVLSTELYLNGVLMADGAFIIDTEDFSYDDAILLLNKLKTVFGTNQIAIGVSLISGSISLTTSPLTPGDYVLLMGVYDVMTSRMVGVKQTTVTVTSPYEPPPTPPLVNKKPVADAGSNVKISVGSTIHFSGADSYDPDGTIAAYSWDFGDGATATGVQVYHTYSEPGHYTATLVVVDDRGAEDSDKCKVFVWKPPAPVADRFGELVPGEQKGFKVDALEAAKTTVTLSTTEPITVTVLRYEENPHPDDPMPANALPIYVDVEVSNSTAVEWPIYVEVHYTDEEAEGLDESLLGIYYWKDGAWHRCSHTGVDTERNVVWAYMTAEEASGSPILVGYTPPKPAEFTVSNLAITPTVITPGEEVTISVLVSNVGEESGTYTVTLKVEGEPTTREVTLEGGESEKLEFKVTRETEGTYKVEVDGISGTFKVKAPPKPRPAEFTVSGLTLTPAEAEEGTEVEVSVLVTNVGEETGTYTVNLYVDGEMVQFATVTLEGGAAKTITFFLTEPTGDHNIRIGNLTASFKVLPKPGPVWLSPGYISGILILILATCATLYILYRRGLLPIHNLPKEDA